MSKYEWEEADPSNPWGRKRVRGTHCANGHEFTPENTFIRPYDKTRVCRECRRQYARNKYQEDKASGKLKKKKTNPTPKIPDSLSMSKEAEDKYRLLAKGMLDSETECSADPGPFIDYPEKVEQEVAEHLCHGCPLIKQCYDFAVASKQEYGIWGGINFTKEVYYDNEWLGSEEPDSWSTELRD